MLNPAHAPRRPNAANGESDTYVSTPRATLFPIVASSVNVDPCGENGEFHTFVNDGPMFEHAIPITPGEIVERDGFMFADFLPQTSAIGKA